jgi:hypothetical protein
MRFKTFIKTGNRIIIRPCQTQTIIEEEHKNGSFDQGLSGCWWTSSTDGVFTNVRQDFSFGAMPKNTGNTIRCLKNNY